MPPVAGSYADAAKRITAYAPVAQEVEHLPFKQGVRGSSPRWSTTSKQGRKVMWRHKHRHIDRRPCFSFSVANPLRWALRRYGFEFKLPRCTKKERIRTGFSPFWWPAYGGQRSASLEFGERVIPSPLALTPCRFETWFGFGLPRCTTSKQDRRVMWRHKHRHIDRRPCFSFSVANPLRWALLRDRFGYGLPPVHQNNSHFIRD